MAVPTDVVLAGTKPFALALFAPLTERTGTRPRIAPDPQQALTLCAASSGLLVVEFAPTWLPALSQLRSQAAGLRIVAALPRGQESAALVLGPLGVDVVPWEGQPAIVVTAVERILAAAPAAVPAPPRPAVTPIAGTVRTAKPPPVAAPPRPAAPTAAPAASRPAVTPIAATPKVAMPPPAVAPRPVVPPVAATAPAPEGAPLDLFADLGDAAATPDPVVSATVDPFAPPGGPVLVAPPPYTGPPAAEARPSIAWPANAPSEEEAEAALVLHFRGKLGPDAPLAAVARQAVATMSELERQALSGAALPFDAQPIYRAAVVRFRVAAALAAVPAPPARVDEAAVQQLLADLDAILAQVNPLAQSAPPEHQPSLEAVRNALVREAVDFSEATHRVSSAGPPPEATARPAPRDQAAGARVLSVHAGEADDASEERRRRGPLILLVIVLILGGGYHAWNFVNLPPKTPPATFEGAPAGTRSLVTENGTWLIAGSGVTVDRAQLERFREQEAKKGKLLREVAPGRWKIEAAAPGGQGATR